MDHDDRQGADLFKRLAEGIFPPHGQRNKARKDYLITEVMVISQLAQDVIEELWESCVDNNLNFHLIYQLFARGKSYVEIKKMLDLKTEKEVFEVMATTEFNYEDAVRICKIARSYLTNPETVIKFIFDCQSMYGPSMKMARDESDKPTYLK